MYHPCELSQGPHGLSVYHLHLPSVYTSQHACVTSQCTVPTHLHTTPIHHPSGPSQGTCVSSLCTWLAASIPVDHPSVSMYHPCVLSPACLCTWVTSQCKNIPAHVCTIIIYHPRVPVYHLCVPSQHTYVPSPCTNVPSQRTI